jgi:hypothetical protein
VVLKGCFERFNLTGILILYPIRGWESGGHECFAIYSGPEEVIVMAKVHPSEHLDIEQLTRAMDALDHRIRLVLPSVADVFIDVTANRTG